VHAPFSTQVLLRRTLFRKRLDAGKTVELEYAQQVPNKGYKGQIELPLVGKVSV